MTSVQLIPMPEYPVIVGRYALFDPIASGGMASVHIGRLLGSFGFARTVAIKRLHQDMALNPEFLAMFLDEARLAARVRHTNVVQTLDVVALEEELLLVMEYVSGAALSTLVAVDRKTGRQTPHRLAVDIMLGVLNGLHAAHEAKNESGEPLQIVHRDVSPQNILVGTDGVARLLDFGIAKAVGAAQLTRPNQIKGKIRYLSPESITGQRVTRASDIYSASVVLWEMLAGRRLFDGANTLEIVRQVIESKLAPPSSIRPHLSRKLDAIVMRGLHRDPARRYATAQDMALALEAAVTPVNRSAVSQWVFANAGDEIRERDQRVAQIEREIQGDGAAVSQRLQSGRALSAERVDKRTLHPTIDSGSAPSVSLEHMLPSAAAKATPPQRRLWQSPLVMGSLVALLVATAGFFWRARSYTPAAGQPLAALAVNGPTPATASARATIAPPVAIPAAAEPLLVAPPHPQATAESPINASESHESRPVAAPPVPAAAPKVRRTIVRVAPPKAKRADRIYRRD